MCKRKETDEVETPSPNHSAARLNARLFRLPKCIMA